MKKIKRKRFVSKTGTAALPNPLRREQALENITTILGTISDPDLILRKFKIARKDLGKLLYDDEIYAAQETRIGAAVATPWRLEPYENEPTQWLAEHLKDKMRSILEAGAQAISFGYSVQEAVYTVLEGGRVGLKSSRQKPMEWFEPQRDGRLKYTAPDSGLAEMVDTEYKFFQAIRKGSYQNPRGEAMLSRSYLLWYFRHNSWRFWMQSLERFADPLLLGKDMNPAEFVKKLNTLGFEAVAATGIDGNLTAVTQGAAGGFRDVIDLLARCIQKLWLGQTLTADASQGGSYAAATVAYQVKDDKRREDLLLLQELGQRVISALWKLNRFAGDPPTLIFQDDAGLEKERAERDAVLINAGALRLSEQYLLDRYDYRKGDFVIPSQPLAITQKPIAPRTKASASFDAAAFSEDQQLIEDLSDTLAFDARSPIDADAIAKAVRLAKTPEDLEKRLAKLLTGAKLEDFRAALERGLFTADVVGYVAAETRMGEPQ